VFRILAAAKHFGEDGSIKNVQLCKTNPISEMPKMIVNLIKTMTNNNEPRAVNYSKQTQTKPNYKGRWSRPLDCARGDSKAGSKEAGVCCHFTSLAICLK
jgi:hypothetical protein